MAWLTRRSWTLFPGLCLIRVETCGSTFDASASLLREAATSDFTCKPYTSVNGSDGSVREAPPNVPPPGLSHLQLRRNAETSSNVLNPTRTLKDLPF